jgi:hypothetical protein
VTRWRFFSMTNSVSRSYTLPVGFPNPDTNELHRQVEVSPMKGELRKKLASEEVRNQPQQGINLVFQRCIESIEGVEPTQKVIQEMTGADRDFCVMKIREISMGKDVTFNFKCRNENCKATIQGVVNLEEDIEEDHWDEETARERLEDNLFTFVITTENADKEFVRNFDETGKFFVPRGQELKQISDTIDRNPIEAQYDLYYLSMLEWNGETREELDFNPFDDSVAGVIDHFSAEFESIVPGPDFSVEFICAECGQSMPADLQGSDFLFPTSQSTKS